MTIPGTKLQRHLVFAAIVVIVLICLWKYGPRDAAVPATGGAFGALVTTIGGLL